MEQILWVEKYRPSTIRDTILPKSLKEKFQTFVDQKKIPNLLLCGGSGIGKTTVARAMLEELGCDYIVINGSSEGGIETLRNDIQRFASSVSLEGGRKYVILDEADYMTGHMQPALRNFMEEFSKNCGFILTCNFKNRIIKALHSRCSVIEFTIPHDEKVDLSKQFLTRAVSILQNNNIEYDIKVLATVIKKYFPDWRRILNELQYYSVTGKIDSGILTNLNQIALSDLVGFMKEKNFTAVRKWVAENNNMDSSEFYREFYNTMDKVVVAKDIPYLVLLISKYSYQDALALDKEINTAAFLVEVMANCQIK